jgi:hypothetical protein
MLFLLFDIIRYLLSVPLGNQYINGQRAGQTEMIDFLMELLSDLEFTASREIIPRTRSNPIYEHDFIDEVCIYIYIFYL